MDQGKGRPTWILLGVGLLSRPPFEWGLPGPSQAISALPVSPAQSTRQIEQIQGTSLPAQGGPGSSPRSLRRRLPSASPRALAAGRLALRALEAPAGLYGYSNPLWHGRSEHHSAMWYRYAGSSWASSARREGLGSGRSLRPPATFSTLPLDLSVFSRKRLPS